MITCTCFFCSRGEAHPDERHPDFHPTTGRLLVAESLDPKDTIPMEACTLCGHSRPQRE